MKKALSSILFLSYALLLFSQPSKYSISLFGLTAHHSYKSRFIHPQLSYGGGFQANFSYKWFQISTGAIIQSQKLRELTIFDNSIFNRERRFFFSHLYIPINVKFKIIDTKNVLCYIPFGFSFGRILQKECTTIYQNTQTEGFGPLGYFDSQMPIYTNTGISSLFKLSKRIFLEIGFDINFRLRREFKDNPDHFRLREDYINYALKTGLCVYLGDIK